MAEWKQKDMMNRVVEFLKSYRRDTFDGMGYIPGIVDDQTIEEIKQIMLEE